VLDEAVICDSLAICEWAAETYPSASLWPDDPFERAVARSIACEMHSGFAPMRQAMPMSVFGATTGFTPEGEVLASIERIMEAWSFCRRRFGAGGPWLFGSYSIADIMYAPVAIRFATFGIELDQVSAAWRDSMLAHPHMREWISEGRRESWRLTDIDTLFDAPWEG
jgi:glutathione S-transferase